jgi:hypothetical protein
MKYSVDSHIIVPHLTYNINNIQSEGIVVLCILNTIPKLVRLYFQDALKKKELVHSFNLGLQ